VRAWAIVLLSAHVLTSVATAVVQRGSAASGSVGSTVTPTFTTEAHSSSDGSGIAYNSATNSVTISGANPLLIACWHAEFGGAEGATLWYWTATYNGVAGRMFVITNGYTGGTANTLLRCYYWTAPAAGAHNLIVRRNDAAGDIINNANELAVAAILINGAAQTFYPFRDVAVDVSTNTRTSETVTVNSAATDLVVHVIAPSLTAQGTLGAGETSRSWANDGSDDASVWFSTKAGGASSTTVSSSGWASTFPIQGIAFSVLGAAEAETTTNFTDTYVRANESPLSKSGVWTSPVGNVTITKIDVVSNQAKGNTAAENLAMVNSPSFPANQRARMTYVGATYGGVGVRMTSAAVASGYLLSTSGAGTLQVLKITDGGASESYSQIGADINLARNLVAGDVIELQATGTSTTTLNVYWNQMLVGARTDSSSPFTSGRPFVRVFGAAASDSGFEATSLPVRLP